MAREHFPCSILELENEFIPLRDGTRLAARLWIPEDADTVPVPAILEAIPYRKRDFMRTRDEPIHRYYAGHGYAAVRLDLRGSGDSDGVLDDEYLPREQDDLLEVIEWLTKQPWCDGKVGMTGISWGGFNALQVAARRPAALKAIIALCASDDRYADDAHFMGGCLLNENQIWGTVLFALNALPPDPEVVGDRWREMWQERLNANKPFPALWLSHQSRDEYWKQGSVCEDYSQIECPVYAIGGWADGYTNAISRLLEGLQSPKKGLIGPWAHTFPHEGIPGPAIGYLQEALRWWDRWLKDEKNGIDEEPFLRVWMQHSKGPDSKLDERAGHWVAEDTWPSPRIKTKSLYFSASTVLQGGLKGGALREEPSHSESSEPLELCGAQSTGLTAGAWCEFGIEGEAPQDQRPDDGRSLSFDSAPLEKPLSLLGAPKVKLRLAVDQPIALIAVRLNEVFANGASARVTYGVLNLTHRKSHEHPEPLSPGIPFDVVVDLNHIAHRFDVGSTIRVAVSTAYWPIVWPTPQPVVLSLWCAQSALLLPLRPDDPRDAELPSFSSPEVAKATSRQHALAPTRFTRTVEVDPSNNQVLYRIVSDGGDLDVGSVARIEEIGLDLAHRAEREFRIDEYNPLLAQTMIREHMMLRRNEWEVVIKAETLTTATETEFRVDASLDASEGDELVFSRRWKERIPRKLL